MSASLTKEPFPSQTDSLIVRDGKPIAWIGELCCCAVLAALPVCLFELSELSTAALFASAFFGATALVLTFALARTQMYPPVRVAIDQHGIEDRIGRIFWRDVLEAEIDLSDNGMRLHLDLPRFAYSARQDGPHPGWITPADGKAIHVSFDLSPCRADYVRIAGWLISARSNRRLLRAVDLSLTM